jgi:hypothetical protein
MLFLPDRSSLETIHGPQAADVMHGATQKAAICASGALRVCGAPSPGSCLLPLPFSWALSLSLAFCVPQLAKPFAMF